MALINSRLFVRFLTAALALAPAESFAVPPISLSSAVNPSFGTFLGGASGRDFILNTDGTIGGTNAADYLFGAVAGSINISGQNATAISILANNLSSSGGVTIVNVTCNLNNTGDQDCVLGFSAVAAPGPGQNMSIGLEINTTQFHGDNATASASFDIVVNYI